MCWRCNKFTLTGPSSFIIFYSKCVTGCKQSQNVRLTWSKLMYVFTDIPYRQRGKLLLPSDAKVHEVWRTCSSRFNSSRECAWWFKQISTLNTEFSLPINVATFIETETYPSFREYLCSFVRNIAVWTENHMSTSIYPTNSSASPFCYPHTYVSTHVSS